MEKALYSVVASLPQHTVRLITPSFEPLIHSIF